MKLSGYLLVLLGLAIFSCKDDTVAPGLVDLNISFSHLVDGTTVQLDQLIYKNTLDQEFSIKTIKYFISQVKLYGSDNSIIELPDIHYIDIRTIETLNYTFSKQIPDGDYKGISFVYGLIPEENITGSLGLELDRLMEWPVPMGGGYHYAKIEGEFKTPDTESFFNFHSGAFEGVDYSIHVDFLNQPFTYHENNSLSLKMEMQNWFTNPTDWDFEYFGEGIMGNPEAQKTVQENGVDVFSFEISEVFE